MNNPGYYAVIPANVRYNSELNMGARMLYGEITALCNSNGYCWATNEYFAELYGRSSETISRWISKLHDLGYINVEINKIAGNSRRIYISDTLLTKTSIPIDKNVKSYIRMNNTINNTENNSALDFLKENSPSRYETFLMNYKSKIHNWSKFEKDFNNKVIVEGLDFDSKKLFARLEMYAGNWIENHRKNTQIQKEGPSAPEKWS